MRKFLQALILSFAAFSTLSCCREQWRPGARRANGSTFEVLRDRAGLLYTMRGLERVSPSEQKPTSLFHALVLLPDVQVYGSGSGITMSCLRATETFHWLIGDYKNPPTPQIRREIQLIYDGAEQSVHIAQAEFDLSHGNLFVVTIDDRWHTESRQLSATLTDTVELPEVLSFLKATSPQKEFEMIHLHSEKKIGRSGR